jgi:hypothetical protein
MAIYLSGWRMVDARGARRYSLMQCRPQPRHVKAHHVSHRTPGPPHSLPPALDYDRIMLLLTPRSPSTNSMVRPAGPDKERQRLYRIHEVQKLKEGKVKDVVMRQGTSAPHTEYRTLLPLESPASIQIIVQQLLYRLHPFSGRKLLRKHAIHSVRAAELDKRVRVDAPYIAGRQNKTNHNTLFSRNLARNTVRPQKEENVMPANRHNVQMLCTLSSPRRAGQPADRPHDSRPPSGALIPIVSANPWTLKFERESGTPGRSKKHDNSGLWTLLASRALYELRSISGFLFLETRSKLVCCPGVYINSIPSSNRGADWAVWAGPASTTVLINPRQSRFLKMEEPVAYPRLLPERHLWGQGGGMALIGWILSCS